VLIWTVGAVPPGLAQSSLGAHADLLLILDASGSMWGQVGGEAKIGIARRALGNLIDGLPAAAELGLVAYGHRREGDCADVETLVPLGPLDAAAVKIQVKELTPKGKTPITAAIEQAIATVRARPRPATVVLVSDGLETCGGDPCAAVRQARASGVAFVLHVVGFDVGSEDASQLECAAQAGGGRYFDARDASALVAALEQTVADSGPPPTGGISLRAVRNGELADVAVRVRAAAGGDELGFGRTYEHPETNPRFLPLAAGTYDVEATAVRLAGEPGRRFQDVAVADGKVTELVADFTAGELAVKVTRNGALTDASVTVYAAGTRNHVAGGRTYRAATSNPRVFALTPGDYDVEIVSVEVADRPTYRFERVTVAPGARAERAHEMPSGTLRVGVRKGAVLIDAVVTVLDLAGGASVAAGRTYSSASSNPKSFELSPGRYRVVVKPLGDAGPQQETELEISAGATRNHLLEL
jgi:Ca-activated chloride channel family protein